MNPAHPESLVETDWLAAHLEDPALRVLECTTLLHPLPDGGFRAESGYATWQSGHIPGSGFADLTGDLSDRTSPLRFMMPPPAQLAAAMGASRAFWFHVATIVVVVLILIDMIWKPGA